MALIEQTLFNTIDKVQIAIERLRAFEPKDCPNCGAPLRIHRTKEWRYEYNGIPVEFID